MPRGKANSPEARIRQLSGLRQYIQNPGALDSEKLAQSAEETAARARGKALEKEGGYKVSLPVGEIRVRTDRERKFIREIFKSLSSHFDWTKHPDDLRKLIILELRFKQIEEDRPSKDIVQTTTALSSEIRLLKEKLGITKGQLGGEQETAYALVERTKAEARKFIDEHRGQFEWKCAHCGGMNLMEAPHFAFDPLCSHGSWDPNGNFIEDHLPQDCPKRKNYGGQGVWNNDIAQLVREGVLTPVQAAKILRTSPIAFLATAQEIGVDLGLGDYDMNSPDTLERLLNEH